MHLVNSIFCFFVHSLCIWSTIVLFMYLCLISLFYFVIEVLITVDIGLWTHVQWLLTTMFLLRVGLTRISSQLPVSDLSEWRHICHFFWWQKMWRVTFVTFLGRMWCSRTRKYIIFDLWRFLSHLSRKTSHFGPAGTKKKFEREEMWRFGWDWNIFFSSRLRVVTYLGSVRPFGLKRPLNMRWSVLLCFITDVGESLRSRGQFLTAVDLGWPDPYPSP